MSNLNFASLRCIDASDANIVGVLAHNSNWQGSNVCGTNFGQSQLNNADFRYITMDAYTSFAGADCRDIQVSGTFINADGTQVPLTILHVANAGGICSPIALAEARAAEVGMNFAANMPPQTNEPAPTQPSASPLSGMPQLSWADHGATDRFDPGSIPGGDGQSRGNGGIGTA